MKKIVLNEDLIYDLYGKDMYLNISNKDLLKNYLKYSELLELKVCFSVDILESRFRSLLKKIESLENKDDNKILLNVCLIYEFNTKDNSFKLIKDDTKYYIKGDYILKNEELLPEIENRLTESYNDIKNRIDGNKLFKIIDVESEDSKSYEEKLSEIIEVEKEAINLCKKVKVEEYSIDLESYINQYYEDDEYDEDDEGIVSSYEDIIYEDIKSIISEIGKLSDSTNSTKVEEYWENDYNVTFRVLERNHLYYYDLYNGEDYVTEDVFDSINNDMLGNFTGLDLLSKVEPQNNFADDDILNSIDSRYEEVVLNKEDYLEEVKSIVDEIVKAIDETYAKLEELIKSNGF